jgi:hypothetical protein
MMGLRSGTLGRSRAPGPEEPAVLLTGLVNDAFGLVIILLQVLLY